VVEVKVLVERPVLEESELKEITGDDDEAGS
jgi:hypothetical protein